MKKPFSATDRLALTVIVGLPGLVFGVVAVFYGYLLLAVCLFAAALVVYPLVSMFTDKNAKTFMRD